ncbi:putative LRR containing protein [Trachipleistophora hominis]|uniref:Putative LRR containing protein n=1 Tax=Trachipleistophora hominis TaxID=72359 RepID=L7JUC0_TRAHO|nr:putative LRR containing protein [Trachipleistophora hominis]
MSIVDMMMNKVFCYCFNYRMKIRITYLNLDGFNLDEQNVEMLKTFSSLETLIVSSYSVRGDFFLYLPVYLESLELVPTTFPSSIRA